MAENDHIPQETSTPGAATRVKRWSSKCDEGRPACLKCTKSGRECGGYEVAAFAAPRTQTLLPRPEGSQAVIARPVAAILPSPQWSSSLDAQAFDYFRLKTAPALAGHFSANVWENLVLQLSQRHQLVRHASVAVGSLLYFRSSGPGCLTASKTAKPHQDLALSSYAKAIAGLRSYIAQQGQAVDEEATLVVLISCLLFVCFEMLQGDQRLTISHLVKGMQILFARYKPAMAGTAVMRPVILGTDFPDLMDNLADVFVRLDSDSTMFGRRSTYLCTSCRCCCVGSVIRINHSFASAKEARAHLDLLTSNTFRWRGNLLKLTEKIVRDSADDELWSDAPGTEDWAKRYCSLYAASRAMQLDVEDGGAELLSKQAELITAFEAWYSAFADLPQSKTDLSIMLLRIDSFFPWFVLSTLLDREETSCDRFAKLFEEIVELASLYLQRTSATGDLCAFSLESGLLRTLYIIGLKCRDSTLRHRAIDLLRNAPVQEGLWSGKVFAAYVQHVADVEERQARALVPDLPADVPLSYELVPEEARIGDVVLASDDTRPALASIICSQRPPAGRPKATYVEHRFQLFTE